MKLVACLVLVACSQPDRREDPPRAPTASPVNTTTGARSSCGEPAGTKPPSPIAQLEASLLTTCARLENGEVRCWGARGRTLVDTHVPGSMACPIATLVEPLSPAIDLRNGCVVHADHTMQCGQLSTWTFEPPIALDARSTFYAGNDRTCAITNAGTVRCGKDTPPELASLRDVDDVVTKDGVVCVVRAAVVTCLRDGGEHPLADHAIRVVRGYTGFWVLRDDGSLAQRTLCPPGVAPRSCVDTIGSPRDIVDVASFEGHVCVATKSGSVWCKDDDARRRPEPDPWTPAPFTEVAGVRDATRVAVGAKHACALLRSGEVMCWGENQCGAVGVGTSDAVCDPVVTIPPTIVRWAR